VWTLYPEHRPAIRFLYQPEDDDEMEFRFQVVAKTPADAETTAVLHMALILWQADVPQPWIGER
jgi:hypothetical protein